MQDGFLSARLRELKDSRRLTARQMADKTGIPVRTLESYMRNVNAPLPGVEALVKLAKGLDIPLDWLLLGNEEAAARVYFFTHFSVDAMARSVIKDIYIKAGRDVSDLTVKAEAQKLANDSARTAEWLVLNGVATLDLALRQFSDRVHLEADLRARIEELTLELKRNNRDGSPEKS